MIDIARSGAGQRTHIGLNLGHTDPGVHDRAESIMFGFWVFMMSDLLLFALLIATYAVMSVHGLADAPRPHEIFELKPAAIETGLLLASSFTFGFASLANKYSQNPARTAFWIGVSALLGAAFLYFDTKDFVSFWSEGARPSASAYWSTYWTLVGCHYLHVFFGILWVAVMIVQLFTFGLTARVKLRIMRLALFWHLLDVVWIAIFTFVFLFGIVK